MVRALHKYVVFCHQESAHKNVKPFHFFGKNAIFEVSTQYVIVSFCNYVENDLPSDCCSKEDGRFQKKRNLSLKNLFCNVIFKYSTCMRANL